MTLTPVKVLYVNKNTKYSNILCFVITFIKKTHQINFKAFNFSVSVFILKNFLLEKYGIMLSFFRYYINMSESVIIFFVITIDLLLLLSKNFTILILRLSIYRVMDLYLKTFFSKNMAYYVCFFGIKIYIQYRYYIISLLLFYVIT